MFYDVFVALCKDRDITPSAAAEAIGFDKSNVTQWKNKGLTPRAEALDKIANYFDVPLDFLLRRPPFDGWDALRGDRSEFVDQLQPPGAYYEAFSLGRIDAFTTSEFLHVVARVAKGIETDADGRITFIRPVWSEPKPLRADMPPSRALMRLESLGLTDDEDSQLCDFIDFLLSKRDKN